MSRRAGWLLLGLALLLGAGRAGRDLTTTGGAPVEPLARALSPLGPVKAIISAALWVQLLDAHRLGPSSRHAVIARALLDLHPELVAVREFLAGQLIATEASRAIDPERHAALVRAGLAMIEEGLAIEESPRLYGMLGQLLALRGTTDPRFAAAAERYFGLPPEEVAIDALRQVPPDALHAPMLADLLVRRAERTLSRREDIADGLWSARRDLEEAEALLDSIDGADAAAMRAELRRALQLPEPGEELDP